MRPPCSRWPSRCSDPSSTTAPATVRFPGAGRGEHAMRPAILEQIPEGRLFIGGTGWDNQSGRSFPTYNPATGEVLGHVPLADAGDVDRAVRAAFDAFPGWAAAPGPGRGGRLRALAAGLPEDRVGLARPGGA